MSCFELVPDLLKSKPPRRFLGVAMSIVAISNVSRNPVLARPRTCTPRREVESRGGCGSLWLLGTASRAPSANSSHVQARDRQPGQPTCCAIRALLSHAFRTSMGSTKFGKFGVFSWSRHIVLHGATVPSPRANEL